MSQSTLDDDELFGEAANEMRSDVEASLADARDALPEADAVWDVEADNTLGVLNALKTALDVGDAEEHLRDAKKWYTMGERADAFEDADDLAEEIDDIEAVVEDVEDASEQVGDLTATIPQLRSTLEDLASEAEDADEDATEADADGETEAEACPSGCGQFPRRNSSQQCRQRRGRFVQQLLAPFRPALARVADSPVLAELRRVVGQVRPLLPLAPAVGRASGGLVEALFADEVGMRVLDETRLDEAAAGAADGWGEWEQGTNLAYDTAEFSENGTVGDPREGGPERGEQLLDEATAALSALLSRIATRNLSES